MAGCGKDPMNNRLASLSLLTALLLSACALQYPARSTGATTAAAVTQSQPTPRSPTAETAAGQPAQRIVTLAPSNTEILFALGAGQQLVGRDSFSDFPPEARAVPDVGGGFMALNTELIVAAEPDLVLVSPLTPPEQLADLDKIGLTVHVVQNPTSFEDLLANLEEVAKLTGHEPEGAALVAALRARVDAVEAQVAQADSKPLVYYELDATDPSAPYTSGPGTFVDLLIRSAGGENFGAGLSGEWVQVSVEELLARQPDFIVLGDFTYGGVTAEQVRARSGWDALAAVQEHRIFTFDDNLVSRPGPRLVDGLEAMAKLLHPDLVW
jgi:iron complex transport system substrate-binding protein